MRAVPIRRAAQDVAGKHLRCAQQDLGSEQAAIRMTKIQAPLFVSAVVLRDEGQHLFTQIRDIRRALAVRGDRWRAWALFRGWRVVAPAAGHWLIAKRVRQAHQDEVLDCRAFAVQAPGDRLDQRKGIVAIGGIQHRSGVAGCLHSHAAGQRTPGRCGRRRGRARSRPRYQRVGKGGLRRVAGQVQRSASVSRVGQSGRPPSRSVALPVEFGYMRTASAAMQTTSIVSKRHPVVEVRAACARVCARRLRPARRAAHRLRLDALIAHLSSIARPRRALVRAPYRSGCCRVRPAVPACRGCGRNRSSMARSCRSAGS